MEGAEGGAPGARSKSTLRQRLPRTYTWLYRNDRAWMDAHSPAPRRAARPKQKVDWRRLDADLAAAVPAVAKTLKEDVTEKPRRVTVTSLARALGQLHNVQKKARQASRDSDGVETRGGDARGVRGTPHPLCG